MANNTYIHVAGPVCGGAPYPPFNEKAINESQFEYDCRFKSCSAMIKDGIGYVNWESYDADQPTDSWKTEILRAFIANGLSAGATVCCKFTSRCGSPQQFDLLIV